MGCLLSKPDITGSRREGRRPKRTGLRKPGQTARNTMEEQRMIDEFEVEIGTLNVPNVMFVLNADGSLSRRDLSSLAIETNDVVAGTTDASWIRNKAEDAALFAVPTASTTAASRKEWLGRHNTATTVSTTATGSNDAWSPISYVNTHNRAGYNTTGLSDNIMDMPSPAPSSSWAPQGNPTATAAPAAADVAIPSTSQPTSIPRQQQPVSKPVADGPRRTIDRSNSTATVTSSASVSPTSKPPMRPTLRNTLGRLPSGMRKSGQHGRTAEQIQQEAEAEEAKTPYKYVGPPVKGLRRPKADGRQDSSESSSSSDQSGRDGSAGGEAA